MITVSDYYKQSVELGKKFQKENSSWAGPDLYWWFRDADTRCNDWYQV